MFDVWCFVGLRCFCVLKLVFCFEGLVRAVVCWFAYSLFECGFGLFVYNSVVCIVRVNIVSIYIFVVIGFVTLCYLFMVWLPSVFCDWFSLWYLLVDFVV